MAKSNKIITVKLDDDVRGRLQHLSKVKSRSKHWLVKTAIHDYVEKEQQKEVLRQETLKRWKEAEAGKIIDHTLVTEWLDSWGTDNEKNRP